jgi:hypothetical protein
MGKNLAGLFSNNPAKNAKMRNNAQMPKVAKVTFPDKSDNNAIHEPLINAPLHHQISPLGIERIQ